MDDTTHDADTLDLAAALGAESGGTAIQVLTLYIASHDRNGTRIKDQDEWATQAEEILASLGGGVTVPPKYRGGWFNPETGKIIWEEPLLPYTYIDPACFEHGLSKLRAFLHALGRETRQGVVAFEFDGEFYRITDFDERR